MSEMMEVDAYVRAYTEVPGKRRKPRKGGADAPSRFSLIFDWETTTDAAQAARVCFFQVREDGALLVEGVAIDPARLSRAEAELVRSYAVTRGLTLCTLEEFRTKVFLRVGYEARAAIIGFNLPFDLSRIALDWTEARGSLRGGYSLPLTLSPFDPSVRIKHLSSTTALIDFSRPAGQDTPRGMRKRQLSVAPHRGYFYDVRTLAAALHSQRFTLGSLANFLGTPTRKHEGVDYDGPLTETFLDYARADVQVTWECFERLRDLYASYRLATPLHRIQSSASIGKACLRDICLVPLLELEQTVDDLMFGTIMPTYFGGRAEVRIRREVRQVMLCDYKSMYPTVNTLIRLWLFQTAQGYTVETTTRETQAFLDAVEPQDLQSPSIWPLFTTLVQIAPDCDVLPLRTQYSEGKDALTIGLNIVSSKIPLWYTLADVAASKLLTGKTPIVLKALTFRPGPRQTGLKRINLLGNPAYCIDPLEHDPYKRLVDMRDAAPKDDPARNVFKTINNSTAYGISVEVIRDDAPKAEPIEVVGPDGRFQINTTALEEPGKYFHPLLATFITGAARLMLALAERVARDNGLGWAFCDTDSIALARPHGMLEAEFYDRCNAVVDWFVALNPYDKPGSILKIEDYNFDPASKQLRPLFAYAISAKRYALFNVAADGSPVIRKASAHGLGHLMEPYGEDDPAPGLPPPQRPLGELGVKLWQHDLWFVIVRAALAGEVNKVQRDWHPALQKPAGSRYAASNPALLRWLDRFNAGKGYAAQVKPFGFLVAFSARSGAMALRQQIELVDGPLKRGAPRKQRGAKPIAPYERDPAIAASRAFDRETGEPVPIHQLQTYAETLARYHLSPEDKFENGDYRDTGETRRRHLRVTGIRLIGKEANKVGDAGEADPTSRVTAEFNAADMKGNAA